jgi:hypothetical protein
MTGKPSHETSTGFHASTVALVAPAKAKFVLLSPRSAISATFFAFGIASGIWSGSSAAILARAGVGAWTFGIALTCFTGVYLAAMSSAVVAARKFTVKRTLIGSLLAIGPILGVLLSSSATLALFASLIAYGLLAGSLDATMNAEGARIERGHGIPIFARLHGSASAGGAAGAILGSLISTSAAPWASGLIAEVAVAGAALSVALTIAPDAGDKVGGPLAVPARILSRSLVVLGLAIGVSIACESATISWSALLLRREAPQWAAFAGLGSAFFFACQAGLRVNADALRSRVRDRSLMLLSFVVAAIGLGIVACHAGFAASVVGFAIVGIGTAAIVPCGFALAASQPGVSPGAAISVVAFFGSFPRLPAPLATGAIANVFSLSVAFSCLAALLAAGFAALFFMIPAQPRAHRGAHIARSQRRLS